MHDIHDLVQNQNIGNVESDEFGDDLNVDGDDI